VTATVEAPAQSLEERIRTYLDGDVSLADATRRFILDLEPEERDEMLYRLAYNRVRITLRSRTRTAERRVFGDDPAAPPLDVARSMVSEFRDERFALPSGDWVTWLGATVADHRERADWQRALAGGCVEDAERHETAIAMIEEAGVTCLRELTAE